jgi:Spy/CpxP family protein refolding chaperone
MRTFGKTALALGLVVLIGAPAVAQQGKGQPRGMFGGGGGAMLLINKSVQTELKVTPEQASKLKTLADELGEKAQAVREKLQSLSQEERREKMREIGHTQHQAMMKSLGEILKPEQVTRLEQIHHQVVGVAAFAMPSVQEKLKLTDDQKSKIREIEEESRTSMREAFQGFQGDREGAMKKIAELRKENLGKAVAVLTDSQKATWKEMTGAPFELKMEPGQGGPGGRPAARRGRAAE